MHATHIRLSLVTSFLGVTRWMSNLAERYSFGQVFTSTKQGQFTETCEPTMAMAENASAKGTAFHLDG